MFRCVLQLYSEEYSVHLGPLLMYFSYSSSEEHVLLIVLHPCHV